ncbi:Uncharacterised protein [Bordetella pertussis]|nr:Uncharacterised protein [Bordetella pertussis]
MLRPRCRNSPRQYTVPWRTAFRYWVFISSVRPAPCTWLSRCPIEMSITVAMMPPCRLPCGLNRKSWGSKTIRHWPSG